VSLKLVVRRILFLFLVVWTASTITFFIPRMSTRNPIRERFAVLARTGGFSPADLETIIASYNTKFGLDKPILVQYWIYMSSVARFDLGVSLNKFPRSVVDLIMDALPWTIGLLFVTTVLSFLLGMFLGALAAWPHSPGWIRSLATSTVMLMGVPPVLMGILLIFFIAYKVHLLPMAGSHDAGSIPAWTLAFSIDVLKHQILPGLSLLFGTLGGWVLGMRGMGVTVQGEDYVLFAEHKGLNPGTIFRDYYLRNALLPQVTGLALALGTIVTSAIVVEQVFGLPGLGTTLYQAIQSNDFTVIYGVTLFITIAVAGLMVMVELLYPLLDPRIRTE
jgi:peptide/nickel transport system permease protein